MTAAEWTGEGVAAEMDQPRQGKVGSTPRLRVELKMLVLRLPKCQGEISTGSSRKRGGDIAGVAEGQAAVWGAAMCQLPTRAFPCWEHHDPAPVAFFIKQIAVRTGRHEVGSSTGPVVLPCLII